jgi:hypothetical protein
MAFKQGPMKSPEESGEGRRPGRGGREARREGGFEDGENGRGSTPYSRKHSAKPGGYSIDSHDATSGRGGSGIIGGSDDFKGHKTDLEHPGTHAEFEALGTEDDGPTGGRD